MLLTMHPMARHLQTGKLHQHHALGLPVAADHFGFRAPYQIAAAARQYSWRYQCEIFAIFVRVMYIDINNNVSGHVVSRYPFFDVSDVLKQLYFALISTSRSSTQSSTFARLRSYG